MISCVASTNRADKRSFALFWAGPCATFAFLSQFYSNNRLNESTMDGKKNITYTPVFTGASLKHAIKEAGNHHRGTQTLAALMQCQHKAGKQVIVERSVTELLMHTDLPKDIELDQVPWLGVTAEIYFEDPALPTLLISYTSLSKMAEMLSLDITDFPLRDRADEPCFNLCYQDDQGTHTLLVHNDEVATHLFGYNSLDETFAEFTALLAAADSQLSKVLPQTQGRELTPLQHLAHIAIGIMFYAATAQEAVEHPSPKRLKQGGKPSVKGRPKRPITRVICLPSIKAQQTATNQAMGESITHKKAGHLRRGFFRHYSHPRFVNKRGTSELILPCWVAGGPKGQSTPYRIR
jgi:hypothetical protein